MLFRSSTGIIGSFKITADTALSTGTRRLVAITGPKALELFQQTYNNSKKLSEKFKVKLDQVVPAVEKQEESYSQTLSQVKKLKKELLKSNISNWIDKINRENSVPFAVIIEEDLSSDDLKFISEKLVQKEPGYYFVASNNKQANKSQFLSITSQEYIGTIDHKNLVEFLKNNNLRGGGRPGTIQGGGPVLSQELEEKLISFIKTH